MTANAAPDPLVPDLMEPLVGWRYWLVGTEPQRRSRYNLVSAFNQKPWPPYQALEARHHPFGETPTITEDARTRACRNQPPCPLHTRGTPGCGIYAMRTPPDGLSMDGGLVVWGRVSLWGRYVIHKRGFRAQYAYPERFVAVMGERRWNAHRGYYIYDRDLEDFIGNSLSEWYGVPYDKENDEWKLAQKNAEASPSRSAAQFPPMLLPTNLNHLIVGMSSLTTGPAPPPPNLYLTPPYRSSPPSSVTTANATSGVVVSGGTAFVFPASTFTTVMRTMGVPADNTRLIFDAIDRLFGAKKKP